MDHLISTASPEGDSSFPASNDVPKAEPSEIPMTAAEYTAWREHVHATLRSPGWESPELRALGEDD